MAPLSSRLPKAHPWPLTPVHTALCALFVVALPALSWLDGSGALAWTMFSKSESYHLEITVVDAAGARRAVAPAALAPRAGRSLAQHLAGAESLRYAPVASTFRRHLAEVGALACAEPGAAAVEIVLVERSDLDAEPRESRARVDCPR